MLSWLSLTAVYEKRALAFLAGPAASPEVFACLAESSGIEALEELPADPRLAGAGDGVAPPDFCAMDSKVSDPNAQVASPKGFNFLRAAQ
jgi:hypothetical protein